MKIIILGAPGSGKGTQASAISKKYKIKKISLGEIFRKNVKKKIV
ncbi:nucleoside monophosphate kinase [Buchnera aphidicola (Astegopteryx bambusae)]